MTSVQGYDTNEKSSQSALKNATLTDDSTKTRLDVNLI
jgi:hypothetical protein